MGPWVEMAFLSPLMAQRYPREGDANGRNQKTLGIKDENPRKVATAVDLLSRETTTSSNGMLRPPYTYLEGVKSV